MKKKSPRKAAKKPAAKKRATRKPAAKPKPAPPAAPAPPKPKRAPRTPRIDKRAAFLAAYAECGSIRDAAKAARIERSAHYRWLKADPDYFARFQEADAHATQSLEDEAMERAMRGVFEPNVFQGRFLYPQEEYIEKPAVIGPRGGIREPEVRAWRDKPGAQPFGIWRKSDALTALLLRGRLREKYGMHGALELSGPGGGAIEIVQRLNAGRARVAALKTAGESDAR
jgi:hypothetical protein